MRAFSALLRPVEAQGVLTLLLMAACILSMVFAGMFGAADIGFRQAFSVYLHALGAPLPADVAYLDSRILLELRLPRILLAFVCGAGLALSGWALQLVTRNPLADPYLFGISAGASLGAIVVLSLTAGVGASSAAAAAGMAASDSWLSVLTLPTGAFVGASVSVLLVLALSGFGLQSQVERMLLSGVATSFLFSALGSLVLYFSSPQVTASLLFWSLGSFARAAWDTLMVPWLVFGLFVLFLLINRRELLAMSAGDETAHSLGVPVARLRIISLLMCSLMTAVLVASCGGIGFVGLMIPHIVRLMFPARQSLMIVAMLGGLLMVWVDVLARALLPSQELPVGVITAVLGSGFFLVLLFGRRDR
ncbi:iron ABC transporter permease [Shewanella sp. JM162201]|uniref:Iron ABC transporter permease n=1 Tax=Shewanella jiangmenensis TaxID=2837387 RepID=A0ABS5V5S6_9GAMM|nr:iron ABC transporter permease [Shewanella jiangmenensis]